MQLHSKCKLCILTTLILLVVLQVASAAVQNVQLRAVTISQPPFVFYNSQSNQYYGYLIDLVREITSTMDNVTIQYYSVPDGTFGVQQSNGSWNGIMGEVSKGRADLSVAPLGITSTRYAAVSYSTSFMDTGLSILVTKELDQDAPFSFLLPFSWEVWVLLCVSIVVVGVMAWIFDRLSPFGYHKQGEETLNVSASMVNAVATMTGQGGETGRSLSSRVLLLGYCFFAMIAISTYTANLSAFLTTKIQSTRVSSLDDLKKYGFKFGVPVASGPGKFNPSQLISHTFLIQLIILKLQQSLQISGKIWFSFPHLTIVSLL